MDALTRNLGAFCLELVALIAHLVASHNKLERRAVLARLLTCDYTSHVIRGCLPAVKYILGLADRRHDLRDERLTCLSCNALGKGRVRVYNRHRWRAGERCV